MQQQHAGAIGCVASIRHTQIGNVSRRQNGTVVLKVVLG
jgi:hypothetical protein